MKTSSTAITLLIVVAFANRALAFHVANGLTDPCHEEMTATAFFETLARVDFGDVPLPEGSCWQRLADDLIDTSGYDPARLDDRQRFVLFSLILGNRITDTGGHSFTDMEAKRWFQADRSDEAQYAHCLRGEGDDYLEGDLSAIAGTRAQILGLVADAARQLDLTPGRQIIGVGIYIDYYGKVEMPVHVSWFLIGRALHTLQDSFSHTIRSEDDGLMKIVTVMNFIDVVRPGYDESRDGLAHSDNMDECYSDDMAPLTAATRRASADFLRAVLEDFRTNGNAKVAGVLDDWMTLNPECMRQEDRCGSQGWFDIARIEPSGDYLEQMIGCGPGGLAGSSWWFLLALVACAFRWLQGEANRKGS
ncbi:MAG: hypothetical protein JRJ19_13635 [Deltaproteobacteria bacterium]|nr:hypothetical protein [Deltaproteobacteria bacterium]MBW1873105.1 hypothetical protein [Deltaproteobacteria bacterium]